MRATLRRWCGIVVNTLSILSLLISLGLAVLWYRSYGRNDLIARVHGYHGFWSVSYNAIGYRSTGGFLSFERSTDWNYVEGNGWAYHDQHLKLPCAPWGPNAKWFGPLRIGRYTLNDHAYVDQISAPYWLLVAVFALPMLKLLHLSRLHGASAARLCTNCGYDLRATPERCPECGHRVDGG